MSVPSSYFLVQNRIPGIMEAIQKAGVPSKFTLAFLESLGFKSTNDRPIISMLKAIGFLDANGAPTDYYKEYKDVTKSKKILGQRLKEAYSDIFLANESAQTLSVENLKGKFASVSGKSDSVAQKMGQTFKSFCSLADFANLETIDIKKETVKKAIEENVEIKPMIQEAKSKISNGGSEFHYNIQIHLPVTRDISVYNAIFKSLKEHLM